MKRICIIGLALLVAVAVVAFCRGYIDPWQPREDVCAQGKALSTARLLDAAKDTYEEGDCAGLQAVERTEADAEEHFAKAGVYASAQRPANAEMESSNAANSRKAIDNFAAGLALDPFEKKARTALTRELDKGLVDPEVQCETGSNMVDDGLLTVGGVALANGLPAKIKECEDALETLATRRTIAANYLSEARDLSDEAEARERYARALTFNTSLVAARNELEGSLNDESLLDELASWIDDIPGALEQGLLWLIPLAIALFLAALAFWTLIRQLSARRRGARTFFERWGGHPGFSFIRSAAVPDIQIGTFTGKGEGALAGDDFATLLKGELYKSTARGPAFPLDRVPIEPAPTAQEGVTLTDLVAEIPATKVLGEAFRVGSKLFRRRKVLLCGHLTPAADKGAGVLLSLKGGRDRDASVTLWERVYDPLPGGGGAVRWLRLVPAAAAWAQVYLKWAQDATTDFEPDDWETEALSRSAEAWELKDDSKRAEALYAAALEKDSGLLPAAHALAVIEIHRGNYVRALQRLDRVRRVLRTGEPCGRTVKDMRCLWPTLDAASRYKLILALAYLERDESSEGHWETNRPGARTEARALASTMARALAEKEARTGADEEVKKEKVSLWWTPRRKKETRAREEARTTEEKREESLEALYEITEAPCVVVLASLELRCSSPGDRQCAAKFAAAGGDGVEQVSRTQVCDKGLESLKPWQLIHGYVEQQPNLPRRTHYNLACYYAALLEGEIDPHRKSTLFERALKRLEAGLVGGELVGWAKGDPSLTPLRKLRPQKFTEVLEASTIEPHEQESAEQ